MAICARGIAFCGTPHTEIMLLASSSLFLHFSGQPVLVGLQIIGAFTHGVGLAALRLRTNTLWPLMILHAAGDMFLAVGQLPVLLVDPIIDTVLFVYGLFLIWQMQRKEPWADTSTRISGRCACGWHCRAIYGK
jgi:hypothetical protein